MLSAQHLLLVEVARCGVHGLPCGGLRQRKHLGAAGDGRSVAEWARRGMEQGAPADAACNTLKFASF